MSRFAKGFIPSPAHKRGLGAPLHLIGAARPVRASVVVPTALDQLRIGACTGNSTAVVMQEAMRVTLGMPVGKWPELPSRKFLYGGARAIEGTLDQDAGAMISDIFEAASFHGFPRESMCPYPTASMSETEQIRAITMQPDWSAFRDAIDQKMTIGTVGAYRLDTAGADLVEQVCQAIAAGHLVAWGTSLDEAFEDLGPNDVWPGVTGPEIGGHAMYFHAYAPAGDFGLAGSDVILDSRSSWDTTFADNGSAHVRQSAITSRLASEFWVVKVAPAYSNLEPVRAAA